MGNIEEKKTVKKKFKKYSIGFFHIDITEVRTDKGKLHLFVSIKRTSKFVVAKIFDRVTTENTKSFFEHLISIVSYCIHTVITDNGIQFADLSNNCKGITAMLRVHIFEHVCKEHDIEHCLTKPNNLWTNGQVDRMNHTIKAATVNYYFY